MKKYLGSVQFFVLVAFLIGALGAPGISNASSEFHSSFSHTVIDSSVIVASSFETTAGRVSCFGATGTSTANTSTFEQITVAPTYSECGSAGLGLIMHIRMRSCDLLFTSVGGMHIQCSTLGDEIRINATFLGAEVACLRIPPQTPTFGSVLYFNEGAYLVAAPLVSGVEYTEVGICDADGGEPNVANDGEYAGQITLSGTNTSGNLGILSWK